MSEVREVRYAAKDGMEIRSYLALPGAGSHAPAIVVLRGVAGGDAGYTEIAARLASWGYPTLVHRWAVRGSDPTDAEVLGDLDAALSYLRHVPSIGSGTLALAGFCKGGIYAFMGAATHRSVGAIVVFHGFARRKLDDAHRLQPFDLADSVSSPSLLLHGTDDKSAPVEGMRELRERLAGSGRVCAMQEFAGAQHGFAVSTHPNFSAEHAASAFDEARQFLATHLPAK